MDFRIRYTLLGLILFHGFNVVAIQVPSCEKPAIKVEAEDEFTALCVSICDRTFENHDSTKTTFFRKQCAQSSADQKRREHFRSLLLPLPVQYRRSRRVIQPEGA